MAKKDRMQEYNEKLKELEAFKEKGQINYKDYQRQKRKIESQKPLPKGVKIFLWSVFALISISFIISIANSPPPKEVKKPSSYNYKFTKIEPIDPTTVEFGLEISNPTDIEWEKPSCTVTIQNPTGTYKGFDTFYIGKTIPAQSSHTFVGRLIITNNGAMYAKDYNVECQ